MVKLTSNERQSPDPTDLFGSAIADYHEGAPSPFVWERSDGVRSIQSIDIYFRSAEHFATHEQALLPFVRGRVLDIGLGAGQHAIALQDRGSEVTGIDVSAACLSVAKARGAERVLLMDAFKLEFPPASFDAVTFFSNDLSIGGDTEGVRQLLIQTTAVLAPGGVVLSCNRDVRISENPSDVAYHAANRASGRLPGHVRMRPHYRGCVGGWIDWLFISLDELTPLAAEAGLSIIKCAEGGGGNYAALLKRTARD